MKFSIYQESRQGGRKYNQDRMGYIFSRDALLMVVADGMGGHLNGEVAAQITLETIGQKFQAEATTRLRDPADFLSRTITHAHHAILQYAEDHAMLEVPRTTVIACVVQDGAATWAHVGDSRLYLIRNGQIAAQTRDHSRVQQLVLSGAVREEAVAAHPDRNKIYNCLGAHVPPQVEVARRHGLEHGDTLLLCSDGVWGPLNARAVGSAFVSEPVARAVPQLLELSLSRAGPESDNTTAIAMTWHLSAAPAAENSVSTLTLPDGDFNSQINTFDAPVAAEELSDDEIEKAIAEIKQAINKSDRVIK